MYPPSRTDVESLALQPMIARPVIVIPIWLRDTYARIHSEPIYHLQGPLNETSATEEAAIQSLQSLPSVGLQSDLFFSGGDIFTQLSRNQSQAGLCDQTITIVIHSLRDLYWNIRSVLSREETAQLEVALKQPLPRFKNIFEYSKFENARDRSPIPLYQMFGTITPFSVIHIPVKHFIEALNAKQPLQVILAATEVMIQLDYKDYDFWNPETQSLLTHIDIRC